MTLKDYMLQLNELILDNPNALDYQVITSSDDEGNNYLPVHYSPAVGHLNEYKEYSNEGPENVVCLN